MLSLSINQLFFRICWDLSPCSSSTALGGRQMEVKNNKKKEKGKRSLTS